MKRLISIASVAGLTLALLCFTPIQAKKPDKPGGGGGGNGGGGGGGSEPFNPAWVVIDDGQLKLMSSNGVDMQSIGKGKTFRRLSAPAWSPDGNWIAYIKAPDILMVRPDGSDNRLLAAFATDDDRLPVSAYGLQWVPGEVDRIIYRGRDSDVYALSTVTPGPPQAVGVSNSGASLGPDLAPGLPGYQGALAFSDWTTGQIVVAYAEDGEFGLEVDLASAVATSMPGRSPAWSHDGLEIAFVDGGRNDWSLRVLPVEVDAAGIELFENEIRTLANNGSGAGDRSSPVVRRRLVDRLHRPGGRRAERRERTRPVSRLFRRPLATRQRDKRRRSSHAGRLEPVLDQRPELK